MPKLIEKPKNEGPILFSAEMVRAILEDRKRMTRRFIKPQPVDADYWTQFEGRAFFPNRTCAVPKRLDCPYGYAGDRLWVKETWRVGAWDKDGGRIAVDYKSDGYARREWLTVEDNELFERLWIQSTDDAVAAGLSMDSDGQYHWECGQGPTRWRPSIFMPRAFSRVRVERLQEISEEDALSEGCEKTGITQEFVNETEPGTPERDPALHIRGGFLTAKFNFQMLWDSINGKKHPRESNPFVWVVGFKRIKQAGNYGSNTETES